MFYLTTIQFFKQIAYQLNNPLIYQKEKMMPIDFANDNNPENLKSSVFSNILLSAFVFLSILFLTPDVFAATWYVSPVVAPGGDGTSWAAAFDNVSAAVTASTEGDDVWVREGTYFPAGTIYLGKTINIYGGFNGSETDLAQRDWNENQTILDGNNDNQILWVSGGDPLVDGIVFTHGYTTSSGGAMVVGSGLIRNCKILDSVSSAVSSNGYSGGGGINVAGSPTFVNCVIAGNSAPDSYGGGIHCTLGSAVFINCTITGNTAKDAGGVYIYMDSGPSHEFYNCIIWGNTATSTIWHDARTSDSTNYPFSGSNNCCSSYVSTAGIYANPMLVDPENGNYHIAPNSPCIDMGTAATDLPTLDMDGDPRQLDGDVNGSAVVDVGADEFDPTQSYYADLYVDGIDGDDGNAGTSWATAKASLQAAIDAAAENNEIWVRSHTYNLSAEVSIDKVLFIYGGFIGTEIQRNSRNPSANPTIINGQDTVRCMHITAAATVNGFIFNNGLADNGAGILASAIGTTIEDSVIQSCSATDNGGGIYCSQTTYINDCSLVENIAGYNGGGIYTISSDQTTVSNCLISGNTANRTSDGGGGGIYNDGGFSPLIEHCIISTNTTACNGGGIHNNERNDARIFACTITLNEASNRGGGIYSGQGSGTNYAQPDIINCVIANNHAVYGGGIYNDEASNSDIFNCTIAGNTAETYGAGLYLAYRYSYAYVMNCIFMGNVLDGGGYADIYFVYFDVAGSSFNNLRLLYNNFSMLQPTWHNAGAPYKTGNMAVSPDFVDYNGPDGDHLAGGDSDYHLTATSQVIDAGIASDATFSLTAPSDDLDGASRPQGLGHDLGAYEYPFTVPLYTLTASVSGGNGTVSPTSGTYFEDTIVNLTATPDAGYRVAAWSGTDDDASTDTANTVTMSSDRVVSVEFELIPPTQYTLTATVSAGLGSIDPSGGTYDEDTIVNLTATPDAGYRVAAWSGTDDDASTDTANTVTMSSDRVVSVEFELIPPTQYTLTATVSAGLGSIDPSGGTYDEDTIVNLTATPDAGYRVAAWSGTDDDASTDTANTVTMSSDRVVSVEFELIPPTQYTLTATVSGGDGTIFPTVGTYAEGTVVELTAMPGEGYTVASWSGTDDDTSKATTNTVTMNSNKSVSVTFTAGQKAMPWVPLLLLGE